MSEKIAELRKANGMTQEELASICDVSRQSVSKWEADIALPETDKLLILGRLFHVSMDVLLKDELAVSGIKEVHTCGDNTIQEKRQEIYEGILIKESIEDENILDFLNINKIELWNTGGKSKYWTVLFFTSSRKDFPEQISKVTISDPDYGGNWFVDFKSGNPLQRINDTGFGQVLMEYIRGNGVVIGVSAGSVIFANNLPGNLALIDTKLSVHCAEGEKPGRILYQLVHNIRLTNTCAIAIRDFPDGLEIIGE